jgi:hypothetical protein
MKDKNISLPHHISFRQKIEGMPIVFNPDTAQDLKATIQFNVSGQEPGFYYLKIDSGNCTFYRGKASNPTLSINTPSEVWMQISSGQLSGQEALLQGLYAAQGDISLLVRFNEIFKSPDSFTIRDTSEPPKSRLFEVFRKDFKRQKQGKLAGKRPSGPIPISGMSWMTLVFVPWTLFWILFDLLGVNPWISSGIPFLLMTLIVLYRIVFNRPAWPEIASWVFFLVAVLLAPLMLEPVFLIWGSITGSLYMAAMWLVSLTPLVKLPFCGEYSKWGFVRALWTNSIFIEVNAAISLVWGMQFIIAAGFGIAAKMVPSMDTIFSVIRYLLMVPALMFTSRYQKSAMTRNLPDIDKTLSKKRALAYFGLLLIVIVFFLTRFILRPSA